MFSPPAGTNHGAPREDATHFNMLVVKSLSSTPRNNAGAFAVIAAGASHSAVVRSWRTRRASANAARWRRDGCCRCSTTTAAARRRRGGCAKLCALCAACCMFPFEALAMLATVTTAIRASGMTENVAQRSNRSRTAKVGRGSRFTSVLLRASWRRINFGSVGYCSRIARLKQSAGALTDTLGPTEHNHRVSRSAVAGI